MSEFDMNRVEKTIKALTGNNMQAFFAPTKEEALQKVKELLHEGGAVTHGGSVTLAQCGIPDLLRSGNYTYLDRSEPGLTRDQIEEIYRKAFFCDDYLTSANAITEDGVLFNVDGNSNRVAAIMFGPKSVIVVAGYNKIVKDLDEAFLRLRTVSAPKNTMRLNCATYCAKAGECVSMKKPDAALGDGCKSDQRICCSYALCSFQRKKDRIKVVIVGEELGY